jgi:hypothetical protein
MRRTFVLLATVCFVVLALARITPAQDAKVAGAWDLSQPGRGGEVATQTLTLEQDGTKLTGSVKGQRGDSPVTGTIMGNNITLSITRTTPNGDVKADYTGTVSGDSMKGTVTMRGNAVDWSAKRSAAGGAGN